MLRRLRGAASVACAAINPQPPKGHRMRQSKSSAPRRAWLQRICLGLLSLFGWKAVLTPLPGPKGVIIVYPHTSNWDFILGLLYRFAVDLPANWLAKDSLFRWPFRGLLTRMGGVPVNRREARGVIAAALLQYREHERLWLALAPEGTRARTDHWKSGFYQIATGADLPCGLGFFDYGTRTVGILEYIRFTGDLEQDLVRLREAYAQIRGRLPGHASEIRFRREKAPGRGA
jgi:1-acyl-sn-glycerol-3-phosphate acyltransferase